MQAQQAKSHSPNTAPTKTAEAPQKAAVSAASASRVPAWAGGMNDHIPVGLVVQDARTIPGIQAKLAISQPNDPYEQEADRIAEHVMRMPASPVAVQRKCACGGVAGPTGECEACAAKRKALQRRATQSATASTAPPIVNQVLSSGNGQPLDAGTRGLMEPRFGTDFSQVRVHTDGRAAESAQSVSALAYTVGSDVVFGKGQYRPETNEGQRLLAHELTHVVQQNGGMIVVQRTPADDPRWSRDEAAARYRGQLMAKRIRDHGKLSKEARAKINRELAYFEGAAKEAYLKEVRPALLQVTPREEIEMPEDTSTVRTHDEPANVSSTSREAELPPFLQAGWKDVNEPGVIYQETGANLRESDDPKSPALAWLPQNAKVHILRHNEQSKWYAVAAITEQGLFGYVADWLVARNPPDPDAGVVKIKPGDTPLELAARYYTGQGFDVWGKDKRYVVNALVWVNMHAKHNFRGDPVIQKKSVKVGLMNVEGGVEAPWWTAQVQSEGYMWLPGKDYLNAIYEEVRKHGGGTGSITADLWHTIKDIYHYAAYGLAFIGGLVHGFFSSLWDAVSGLVGLVYDILKSIFTLRVVSDAKKLISAIENLTWQDIKDAVGEWADKWAAKLNSDSPWTAGHAHGYLTGYVMAEAAMLLLSGGILAEAKGALWGSRLGKALKETRALKVFAESIETAVQVRRAAGGKVAEGLEALRQSRLGKVVKVAEVTVAVGVWTLDKVIKVLNLPGEIARYVAEKIMNHIEQLRPFLERIGELSESATRWLFGCHSLCEWEADVVEKTMKQLSNADIETAAKLAAEPSKAVVPAEPSKSAVPEPPKTKPPKAEATVTEPTKPGANLPKFNRDQTARLKDIGDKLHEHGLNWNDLGLHNEEDVAQFFATQKDVEAGVRALEKRLNAELRVKAAHAEAQHPEGGHSRKGGELPSRSGPDVPEGQRLPRATETPQADYGGFWGGERGNSEWFSDVEAVNNITGYNKPIEFHDGYPDFSPWAKERVRIHVTGIDDTDFAAADKLMAPRRGFRNQTAYEEWRKANRLTWHHVEGADEMILVPRDLHENVPHVGGASEARSKTAP